MNWSVEFYLDARERCPVATFLEQLSPRVRDHIIHHISLLQERGPTLGMPYVRHLQGKLWELRVRAGGAAYRLFYFFHTGRRIIFLHAFVKKTQKTPRKEIDTAIRRLNDFLEQAQ